ncbi:TonB-dependent receptor [Methylopila henanensis]|uniref:TonB-dependent receptor n=1 Tax=Methylopila henanensis TaxID=873516 RepID=A0ABW4K4G2_9HYPH
MTTLAAGPSGAPSGDSAPASSGGTETLRNTLGLLPMIALSAALATPAFGQQAAPPAADGAHTALDEISVIGQGGAGEGYKTETLSSAKATAPLLDTPQTVTVVPRQVIEERGSRTLTEVLRNTPGISFDAGENGFGTSTNNFTLRGFDTSGSVYVDGARDSGSYARDTFNVDRVEVIKGPAADNGRGGLGGYVNIVTKAPTLDTFARGDASLSFDQYGTDPLKRATIDVNRAISETVAIRLNAMGEHGGVMGRDVAESRAFGIAPSISFGLGTATRATLSYEHQQRNDIPDWGVPGATIKGLDTHQSNARARRDRFYGLSSDFDDSQADSAIARFEHDLTDGITVSNQTRWARVDRRSRYTHALGYRPDDQHVTTQTQFYDRVNESLSNQTNLQAKFDTGAFRHTVSTGVEVTRETSKADRFASIDGRAIPVGNPNPDRDPFDDSEDSLRFSPNAASDVKITTVAAYLYDTVDLNEQWQITGGVRVERYKLDLDDINLINPAAGFNYDETKTTLNGKIGLVYKPVREGSLYASFGTTALPPGSFLSNPDISRTGANGFPGFVPGAKTVRGYNYEIGAKWDFFGGALSTTAAAFHTEKHNAPITGADVVGGPVELKGYGKQIVQGVEIGVAGKITEAWSVFGGATLLRSERKHSAYLDRVRNNANTGDYGDYTRTDGDRLAFTPNFSATLWSTYDVTQKFTVGAGVQYSGSSYLGRPDDALRIIPNGRYGKLPSYFLANAMLGYKATENIDVRFNVDNVFGEKYAVTTNWNGSRATLGAPRVFRVSSSFKF